MIFESILNFICVEHPLKPLTHLPDFPHKCILGIQVFLLKLQLVL